MKHEKVAQLVEQMEAKASTMDNLSALIESIVEASVAGVFTLTPSVRARDPNGHRWWARRAEIVEENQQRTASLKDRRTELEACRERSYVAIDDETEQETRIVTCSMCGKRGEGVCFPSTTR